MPKFKVAVYKPVHDLTRAFVTVDAPDARSALCSALTLYTSGRKFRFKSCKRTDIDNVTAATEE